MATAKRKIKAAYARTRVQTVGDPDRVTKCVQSERKHVDINHIVAKAYQTGSLPVLMGRKPVEVLPDAMTYQDALNKVVFAQQAFERLPSEIRAKFENKPEKMLAAIGEADKNPEIKSYLQNVGILEKELPPTRSPAEQSGVAANGGEATAQPPGAPVPAASEGS